MARLDINSFAAQLKSGGARPNLFRAQLTAPQLIRGELFPNETFSFLCKAAQLPASTVGVVPIPFRGRILKVSGDRTFADWTITVISDSAWTMRSQFEMWSNAINSYVSNQSRLGSPNVLSFDQYTGNATVAQLDREGTEVAAYLLEGIWPTEVAAIDLSYESTDQIEEFTVTFAMQYFTPSTMDIIPRFTATDIGSTLAQANDVLGSI